MKKLVLNLSIALFLLNCMAVQRATEIATPTEELPDQGIPTATTAPTEQPRQSIPTECRGVAKPGSSWERYKPNTIADLMTQVSQVSHPSSETSTSYYIETSAEYQFPSCIRMEYEDEYREISEPRKLFLTVWSGIFGEEFKQKAESLKHEMLFTENGTKYWFFVHDPLIPYMKNELTPNKPAVIFVIWAGTVYVDGQADHIFVIGEFSKEE